MNLEVHVTELDQRLHAAEKDIDKLRVEYREYTDSKVREASLKMVLNTREVAQEIAKEVRTEIKKDAGTLAKIAEWAFKLGMILTLGWISVNQAHALTILGS